MNVVWIEDFGGAQPLPANSKTLIPLFQGLLGRETFVKKWDDDDDLLAEPGILSAFFAKHSNHKLVLLKNVFEYLERVGKEEIVSHDVFAIDINLDRNVDYSRALPSDMDELDKPTFHRKAGFYIYNHLIRKGIPPENICLLTGEQGSTVEFNTHCRDSLIPRPTAFEKSDSGFSAFRGWLSSHQEDRYLALRRAIIEGCDYLKERVIEDESAIQFRAFIGSGFGKPGREVTKEDMGDYLDALQQSLPASAPRNGDEKERLFRLFVRALAHEWETRAEPENPRKISSRGSIECRLLPALGWIMKNVRNWMSHNSVINHLDEADVAFLYLVNMRAMFRWDFAPVRFEKLALILLKSGDGDSEAALDESALRRNLVRSYKKIRDLAQSHRVSESRHFASLVNNLAQPGVDNGEVHFVQALYQMFWHGLVPASLSQFNERESRDGKQYLQMACNFNFDVNRFRSSPDGHDDFLYQFARTIYPRSFPE